MNLQEITILIERIKNDKELFEFYTNDMQKYLENLITEKGQDLENDVITLENHFGITFEVLIEYIVAAKQYHKQIRNTLVAIDFKNGDVFHYLKHLAHGMVKQYEATH